MIKNKQQGFTLFEVLISMFIAGVAVLGLVMLELNILRSSQSSFNYTLATIEANTLVDKTWRNLCDIEGTGGSMTVYTAVRDNWFAALGDVNINSTTFNGHTSAAVGSLPVNVGVWWDDKVLGGHADNNKVLLNVTYPDFTGLCL